MRHAKAEEKHTFRDSDALRPLTTEGMLTARKIAQRLVKLYPPTKIITSDYLRAKQTAEIVKTMFELFSEQKVPTLTTETLRPDSHFLDWAEFIQGPSLSLDSDDIVLVVGHEPSMSSFFWAHMGFDKSIQSFKKSGIGILEPLSTRSANLVAFLPPKVMRT